MAFLHRGTHTSFLESAVSVDLPGKSGKSTLREHFRKDVWNPLCSSVKHLFRGLAVESRVFGVLRRSWVFWKDIILLMLGLGMGPLINFLQTILMPRVDNGVGNRGFQRIRSDLRNEFPFEHFDPL